MLGAVRDCKKSQWPGSDLVLDEKGSSQSDKSAWQSSLTSARAVWQAGSRSVAADALSPRAPSHCRHTVHHHDRQVVRRLCRGVSGPLQCHLDRQYLCYNSSSDLTLLLRNILPNCSEPNRFVPASHRPQHMACKDVTHAHQRNSEELLLPTKTKPQN